MAACDYFRNEGTELNWGCLAVGDTTWGFRVDGVDTKQEQTESMFGGLECSTVVHASLIVVRHGAVSVVRPVKVELLGYVFSTTLGLTRLVDYDHDGSPEVLFQFDRLGHHVADTEKAIYSWRNGAPGLYEPARGIRIREVQDVDKDGRPDLVGGGPYAAVALAHHEIAEDGGGDWFVAHALSDGTFSFTDDVATSRAREKCPSQPDLTGVDGSDCFWDSGPLMGSIICARLRGVSARTVEQILNQACDKAEREMGKGPAGCLPCRQYPRKNWAWEMARIEPPFHLP